MTVDVAALRVELAYLEETGKNDRAAQVRAILAAHEPEANDAPSPVDNGASPAAEDRDDAPVNDGAPAAGDEDQAVAVKPTKAKRG